MARIGTLGETGQVSRTAPKPRSTFETAGVEGAALSSMGKAVRGLAGPVGGLLKDLEMKREKAEATEFASSNNQRMRRETAKFTTEKKNEYAGSDHTGYVQDLEARLLSERDEVAAEAPTDRAREMYLSDANAFITKRLIDADSHAKIEKTKFFMGKRVENIELNSEHFYENPDPFAASEEVLRLRRDLALDKGSALFNAEQAKQLEDAARKEWRESTIDGMVRDGMTGLIAPGFTKEEKKEAIKRFLDGNIDGTQELFKGMDTKERVKYSKAMNHLINQQDDAYSRETKILINNAMDVLASGRVPMDYKDEIEEAKERAAMMPGLEGERARKGIYVAEEVGSYVKGLPKMTVSEMMGTDVESVIKSDDIMTEDVVSKGRAMLQQQAQLEFKRRNDDGAAHIQKHYPQLKDNPRASIERQKMLGIQEPRVLTKSETASIKGALLEGGSGLERSMALQELINSKGDYSPQALYEVVKDTGLDKEYMFALYSQSPVARTSILMNAGQKKEINTEFEQAFPGRSGMIKKSIQGELNDAFMAYSQANIEIVSEGLRQAVYTDVQKSMLSGINDSDAIDTAVNKIFNDSLGIYHADKGTRIIYPKYMSANTLDAFLGNSFKDDSLDSFNLSPARSAFADTKDVFYDHIKRNGFWVNTPSMDGIQLMYDNHRQGVSRPVRDKEGAKVVIRWHDMRHDDITLGNVSNFSTFKIPRNEAVFGGFGKL